MIGLRYDSVYLTWRVASLVHHTELNKKLKCETKKTDERDRSGESHCHEGSPIGSNNTLVSYWSISLYYSNFRISFGRFSADKNSAANSASGGGLGSKHDTTENLNRRQTDAATQRMRRHHTTARGLQLSSFFIMFFISFWR